jgi:hypothetical protein
MIFPFVLAVALCVGGTIIPLRMAQRRIDLIER